MHRIERTGDALDHAEFEARVARATAELERHGHRVALSELDVDVPFIRVWGKCYRRVHRIERLFTAQASKQESV